MAQHDPEIEFRVGVRDGKILVEVHQPPGQGESGEFSISPALARQLRAGLGRALKKLDK